MTIHPRDVIPGAETVHAREVWQDPSFPVFGPTDNPANNDVVVCHYTASDNLIDGDPGEHAENLPAYIRAMQRSYALNRGFSLGYLWAVDWLGGIWQIRGWEYQSAANAGHNDHTTPVLVLVDGNDRATDEAAASIRCIVAEAARRSGRPQSIKGHGQLRRETGIGTATACCGTGLQSQIDAGVFVPRPTPPPLPQGDTEMIAIRFDRGAGAWTGLIYTGTHLAHAVTPASWSVPTGAGVKIVDVDATQLNDLIRSSATTTPCPPEFVNTTTGAIWTAARA